MSTQSIVFRKYSQNELHYFVSIHEMCRSNMNYGYTVETIRWVREAIDGRRFRGERRQTIKSALTSMIRRGKLAGASYFKLKDHSVKVFLKTLEREIKEKTLTCSSQ